VNIKKIYIWCCDNSKNTGEGILANKFLKDLKFYNSNIKIIIKTPQKNNINSLTERFIFPIKGLIYLWIMYISKKNKKICYLNYLPLWNFFLFLFLPPKTIFGPITGGSLFSKTPFINYFLRKYILNFFSTISKFIIKFRKKKLLFSTNLLKKKIGLNDNFFFNYILKDLKITKNKEKKIYDLIFYLRNHKNKNISLQIQLAKKLSKKFKILTIGEKIYKTNVRNLGFIPKKKLLKVLRKTKFSFLSGENLYSFFAMDCIASRTNILFNKNVEYKSKNFNGIEYFNYDNFSELLHNIEKTLNKKFKYKIINCQKKISFKNYFTL